MADHLEVDSNGLRSASASNDVLASGVVVSDLLGSQGGCQVTVAAVQAMHAAVAAAHLDQAGYLESAAESLRSGAGDYDDTDVSAGRSIAGTM